VIGKTFGGNDLRSVFCIFMRCISPSKAASSFKCILTTSSARLQALLARTVHQQARVLSLPSLFDHSQPQASRGSLTAHAPDRAPTAVGFANRRCMSPGQRPVAVHVPPAKMRAPASTKAIKTAHRFGPHYRRWVCSPCSSQRGHGALGLRRRYAAWLSRACTLRSMSLSVGSVLRS
jgi:hypothetical protein